MTISLIGSVVDIITTILSTIGLPGLFALMVFESFGVPPLPSEIILPFAGFLVAAGTLPLGGVIAAALAGGLVGAYAAYAVGRWWRHRITGIGIGSIRLEASHLERMDRFFARRGEATVAIARLIPVVRAYISYPAGTAGMPPARFGLYTLLGATPFTLAFLYAGFVLRSNWTAVSDSFRYIDYAAIALVLLGLAYFLLLTTDRIEPGWPPRWRRKGTPPASSLPPNGPDRPGPES